jgi:hypothetical protein
MAGDLVANFVATMCAAKATLCFSNFIRDTRFTVKLIFSIKPKCSHEILLHSVGFHAGEGNQFLALGIHQSVQSRRQQLRRQLRQVRAWQFRFTLPLIQLLLRQSQHPLPMPV